jgi:ubiquinone/menaquinone biosynthesis C-methylase UbiE
MTPALDYSEKQRQYFDGTRTAFVQALPHNSSARLLEVGCGNGGTASQARAEGKCGWCCGIELCEAPAREAAKRLDQVLMGNVEQMELDLPRASFDILILSEVLEHLVNPGAVLRKLSIFLKPGALVLAGSPNVCHHSVLRMLLVGRWDYQGKGIMDATHLRWFTAQTYQALFEDSGYVVDHVGSANPFSRKARLANALLFKRWEHLFYTQIFLRGHLPDVTPASNTDAKSESSEWTPMVKTASLTADATVAAKLKLSTGN